MKQQTLTMADDESAGFEKYRRQSPHDVFSETINEIMPWMQLCEVVEPHSPTAEGGRPAIGVEPLLCMHFVQHCFNLPDVACEEALPDSTALKQFVGIDLGRERS